VEEMSAFCPSFYCVRKLIADRRKTDTLQVSAKRSFDGQTKKGTKRKREGVRVIGHAQERPSEP